MSEFLLKKDDSFEVIEIDREKSEAPSSSPSTPPPSSSSTSVISDSYDDCHLYNPTPINQEKEKEPLSPLPSITSIDPHLIHQNISSLFPDLPSESDPNKIIEEMNARKNLLDTSSSAHPINNPLSVSSCSDLLSSLHLDNVCPSFLPAQDEEKDKENNEFTHINEEFLKNNDNFPSKIDSEDPFAKCGSSIPIEERWINEREKEALDELEGRRRNEENEEIFTSFQNIIPIENLKHGFSQLSLLFGHVKHKLKEKQQETSSLLQESLEERFGENYNEKLAENIELMTSKISSMNCVNFKNILPSNFFTQDNEGLEDINDNHVNCPHNV